MKDCYKDFLKCVNNTNLDRYTYEGLLQKMFEIKNPPYNLSQSNFGELREKLNWLFKGKI